MKKFYLICLIMIIGVALCADKILVLPFQNDFSNKTSLGAVRNYLTMLLEEKNFEVVFANDFEYDSDRALTNEEIVKSGKSYQADQVVYINMQYLGNKIIILAKIVDAEKQKIVYSKKFTSLKVEELDAVMDETVAGFMKERESKKSVKSEKKKKNKRSLNQPVRKKQAKRYNGITFGYLFPLHGFDGDRESKLTADYRFSFEMANSRAGVLAGWREGVAASLFYNYLFTDGDISPYAGGNLGFHWIDHDSPKDVLDEFGNIIEEKESMREDGIELGLNCGINFFRYYNFQMVANLEYTWTLNDYDDQSIIFTIGLMQ
ncbi:MAG: hypothetical protein CSB55_05345 [Candidatus Cloacimonadota bacterium]|nr:MAG: hypothetical protein CSB55_05345 [Candidatus Cloacimonadota bacterium]